MNTYFIAKQADAPPSTRVTVQHLVIFHGVGTYPDRNSPDWVRPSPRNTSRGPLHIIRSGRYVPPVFAPTAIDFAINDSVRRKLVKHVKTIEFGEVVFEHLVDVEMMPLGASSIDGEATRVSTDTLLMSEDVAEFHETVGRYSTILAPSPSSPEYSDVDDYQEVDGPIWGSCFSRLPGRGCRVSTTLLKEYGLHLAPGAGIAMREDVFEIIIPFVDLDCFKIAFSDLDRTRRRINPLTGETHP